MKLAPNALQFYQITVLSPEDGVWYDKCQNLQLFDCINGLKMGLWMNTYWGMLNTYSNDASKNTTLNVKVVHLLKPLSLFFLHTKLFYLNDYWCLYREIMEKYCSRMQIPIFSGFLFSIMKKKIDFSSRELLLHTVHTPLRWEICDFVFFLIM